MCCQEKATRSRSCHRKAGDVRRICARRSTHPKWFLLLLNSFSTNSLLILNSFPIHFQFIPNSIAAHPKLAPNLSSITQLLLNLNSFPTHPRFILHLHTCSTSTSSSFHPQFIPYPSSAPHLHFCRVISIGQKRPQFLFYNVELVAWSCDRNKIGNISSQFRWQK